MAGLNRDMDFVVTNLNDSGFGSLRWAIGRSNALPGFDQILFNRSLSGGTITLASALPHIRDRVALQGLVSDAGLAALAIDCNGHDGLVITGRRAAQSSVRGLAIGNANGSGLTLDAARLTVQNTLIGVGLDGNTAMGNRNHGIHITERSHRNLIGTLDPLTGIPLDQQFSNVISGNGGSGIHVNGGDNHRIANNRIGTNAKGSSDLGNGGHGITLKNQAEQNRIGGPANSGNNPTQGEFQRPGQGNLISGNDGNGVLIKGRSSNNRLLGNFIGTDASGNNAIGNDRDGVAIVESNRNGLIGTTRNKDPFIYYNVVSGNGRHGLRVQDSNNITIHANFFGLGADNQTIVANGGDGALIEGTSKNIQYGGVIPLGNVNAGNQGNGVNVTDQVRKFITFNTFAGLTAFGGIAPNQKSGIRISSDGGRNQARTNVMSGNERHGLHFTGNARGFVVDPNIIGLNTTGTEATYSNGDGATVSWANGRDGIRVEGRAREILIEGQRSSIIPQNTISNNNGYGIRIADQASRVTVDNTFIGLSSRGRTGFGNTRGGIDVEAGTSQIRIGRRRNRSDGNQIAANFGNGIQLSNPVGARLFNNTLNDNSANGVLFEGGRNNTLIGNRASSNQGFGFAISSATNTTSRRNSGENNTLGLFG